MRSSATTSRAISATSTRSAGRALVGRRAVAAEGARDLVEAVDLGEDALDVAVEDLVEVGAARRAGARRCCTPRRMG
jgi:hypothetical protein